jgi:hypothetical protein
LAWDSAHKVLDKDGFFEDEFIVKAQASVNEYRTVHGGWHADDSITDDSEDEKADESEEKHCESNDVSVLLEAEEHEHNTIETPTSIDAAVSRPQSSATSSTQRPSRSTPPCSSTSTPASFKPLAPRGRQNPPRTGRKPPQRFEQEVWSGSRRAGANGGLGKRRRSIVPIDTDEARLPVIPGDASTLAEVMPQQLLVSGTVHLQRDMELDIDAAGAASPASVPQALPLSVPINSSTVASSDTTSLESTNIHSSIVLDSVPTAHPVDLERPSVPVESALTSLPAIARQTQAEIDEEIMALAQLYRYRPPRYRPPTQEAHDDVVVDDPSSESDSEDQSDTLMGESNWSVARSDRSEESDDSSCVGY